MSEIERVRAAIRRYYELCLIGHRAELASLERG